MGYDTNQLAAIFRDQKADLRVCLRQTQLMRRSQQIDLDRMMASKLITVVLGVRRSGKSTLCSQTLSMDQAAHVNFFDITESRALLQSKILEYAKRGGFPEVVGGEGAEPYLRELFDRIISRDVLQRHALKSSKALKELALYLVQNSGSLASYQRLARAFEFKSVHTLKSYVGYLEETYLIQELLAYSNKLRERLTLPRKIYAIDTGMVHALSVKPTPDRGAELENLVFLELRRRTREIKSLIEAAKKLKTKRQVIVTWEEENEIRESGFHISVVPLWRFLLERQGV